MQYSRTFKAGLKQKCLKRKLNHWNEASNVISLLTWCVNYLNNHTLREPILIENKCHKFWVRFILNHFPSIIFGKWSSTSGHYMVLAPNWSWTVRTLTSQVPPLPRDLTPSPLSSLPVKPHPSFPQSCPSYLVAPPSSKWRTSNHTRISKDEVQQIIIWSNRIP